MSSPELPAEPGASDARSSTAAVGQPPEERVVPRRQVISWALWDWATQPFNTVLLTFVWVPSFLVSPFFLDPVIAASGVVDGESIDCDTAVNTATEYCRALGELDANLGWGIMVAGILIALLAPVLGQRADATGRRKLMLGIFTGLLIACQLAMAFVDGIPAHFWFGVAMIAVGSIVGEIAGASYNALLVSVSTPRTVGRVSGLGWGFGYLGGIVALTIVVGLILGGVLDGTEPRTFQLIAAGATVWTIVFSIPIFRTVPEPPSNPDAKRVNFFRGYVELVRSVVRLWRESRSTFWFLLASAVYRDGLAAVFTFGSVIAARVFGFGFTDLVIFGIVLNLVAGVSTIFAGRLDDRFGPKPVILVAIGGIIACCVTVFLGAAAGDGLFWVVGIVLAALVGPAQAASRSFLARLTPGGREGEIFGLYATTGRAASWLAALLWGVFIAAAANQTLYGILAIALVLAIGFVLLVFVKAPPRAPRA
ncbi:MFS transporter [Microbacterium sp. CFBP9034]|uniref:MFS transporter n=1 Tax=Microbacterium sp. CFBP9034 TaxID=3096540 RepID=UPI002A6ABED9|nr:MFS transporter [Microbacterium sp. CFBP9034]MDY0908199.1 MFS transporter [Microbacterium sp. CFBP9034]